MQLMFIFSSRTRSDVSEWAITCKFNLHFITVTKVDLRDYGGLCGDEDKDEK